MFMNLLGVRDQTPICGEVKVWERLWFWLYFDYHIVSLGAADVSLIKRDSEVFLILTSQLPRNVSISII